MMAWVLLKAKAQTAVAVPRRFEAGNLYESLTEIPGMTVRGAFAALYLSRGKPADGEFQRIFENHKIRFGPLRPLPKGIEGLSEEYIPVMPVPKSARSCKYDDGLPEGGHGVLDMLFEVAEEIDQSEKRGEITCSQCGAPIEPLEKPWLVAKWHQGFGQGFGVDYKPDFRLNTHVGIGAVGTEEMGLAMEGRLFSLQCFPQETGFSGWISVNEGDPENLLEALGFERIGDERWRLPFYLRVGRRSSTYGALEVEALLRQEPPWWKTHGKFEERWKKFQEVFWQRFNDPSKLRMAVGDKGAFQNGYVFSVTFLTDTILIDQFLRPYRLLTAEEVARRLGIQPNQIQLLATFARPQIIRGWNTAHRLPKEQDFAIAAGSVFLFIIQKGAIDENSLITQLREWEERGIGWRRSEGFGQILICDPWHLRSAPEELVPLKWGKQRKPLETRGFEKEIIDFVKAIEDKANLTKNQLEHLRARANQINAFLQRGLQNLQIDPHQALADYLKHQSERRISGWGQTIKWGGRDQSLADALIEVLGVHSLCWEEVLKRIHQFVTLMLLTVSGKKLDEQFKVGKCVGGDDECKD